MFRRILAMTLSYHTDEFLAFQKIYEKKWDMEKKWKLHGKRSENAWEMWKMSVGEKSQLVKEKYLCPKKYHFELT